MSRYDVAAYIWPAYTGDEPRARIFWKEGIGEWQTVKNSVPKTPAYFWNRKPLWGYVNEADPYVMESQIACAREHGVNVLIYDWYWYDHRPFLEQCLDNGYLEEGTVVIPIPSKPWSGRGCSRARNSSGSQSA